MRPWILLPLLWAGLLGTALPGRAQQKPKALIEKAVKALGGLEKLTAPGASRRKLNVVFNGKEKYTVETFSSSPRRLKITLNPHNPGQSPRELVIDGDKAWMTMNGNTFNLDNTTLARLKRARHADRVSGLAALLKRKGYTFSSLGEVQVKGKPALGVKVQYKDQPDVHLYFDKKTGFLVKSWQKFTEAGTNQEVTHEIYYFDYQEFNPIGDDEELLKAAGLPTEGKKLVQWLKERTPSGELKKRIQGLIDNLGSNAFRVRTKATVELKKIGLEAAPLLREALKNGDPEVVQRATECLDAIKRDDAVKRIPAAVHLLAVQRTKGTSEALLNYLPWAPTEDIRREVQAALFDVAMIGNKPDPYLVKALTDKDKARREAARAALRRDGGKYEKQPGRRMLLKGLIRPMRTELYKNGQLRSQMQVLRMELFNRLPDHIFARPGSDL